MTDGMAADSHTDLSKVNFYKKKKGNDPSSGTNDLSGQAGASVSDPDVARCLFEEGAFLIFLDVPERTEFGIDTSSWNVGEKFKGIKMIPPGLHFVYYSAVSKDNLTAPRTGFFHDFQRQEVVVKRWDTRNEGLRSDVVPFDEIERISSNLKNLDPFLGAYPYETYKKWISLSRWITDASVLRLAPLGPNGCIFSVQQLESLPFFASQKDMGPSTEEFPKQLKLACSSTIPDLKVVEGTRIRFAEIGTKSLLAGATPSEITRLNMDQSDFLESLIQAEFSGNENEVFGELQFAFVCFLVGQVYDAFEQWKKLVALLCRCERRVLENPHFFKNFISVLYYQLQEVPKDFFVDIVSRENFLTNTLQSFFAVVEGNDDVDEELLRRAVQFRKYLQKIFKWDFTLESNEDAPVIVTL